jgi:hypothetical protein
LDISAVQWSVIPSQMLSWSAMVLVVAFSSCLDVAAIEMEVSKPLDYNKELATVYLYILRVFVIFWYCDMRVLKKYTYTPPHPQTFFVCVFAIYTMPPPPTLSACIGKNNNNKQ